MCTSQDRRRSYRRHICCLLREKLVKGGEGEKGGPTSNRFCLEINTNQNSSLPQKMALVSRGHQFAFGLNYYL